MRELSEEHRVGLDYLQAATSLLQRIRSAHSTDGLYEAADVQWWWRNPRATDEIDQLFWFDDSGAPQAAAITVAWREDIALVPIVMPDSGPSWTAHVVDRGLAHAADSGFDRVVVEVGEDQDAVRDTLVDRGFTIGEDGVVEMWLDARAVPEITPIAGGYRLSARVDTIDRPHPMTARKRNDPDLERRLRQTSLYRPDLDLAVFDGDDNPAAYGLFWFDPETATGLVEPMRTEDEHQRRGLARHVLTTGVNLLAETGAERIKICSQVGNAAAKDLYRDVGFQPDRTTVMFAGQTSTAGPSEHRSTP